MGKRPAFQFYPKDWMADPDLQTCTLSAQGLWILMLCVMHYADPYGHLVNKRGGPMAVGQLAKLTPGYTADQVDSLIAELGDAGVYSQTDEGVIYSRRMVDDYEIYLEHRDQRVAAGRASGRARRERSRSKENERDANGSVQTKSNPSSSSASSSASSTSSSKAAAASRRINRVMAFWEDHDLRPTVMAMSNARRSTILARFAEHTDELVMKMLTNRATSRFLNYEINHGRGASIDWCFGPQNFVKVLDGNYNDDDDGESEWMVETYRASDFATFGEHERWPEYIKAAADLPPRSAPTFEIWLER